MNKSLVYGIALVATLGGFLFGYDTAVISGAISSLDSFFIQPYHFSDTVANTLLGVMVSGALIGCVVGSALGGYFSHKFGRRRSLIFAAVLFTCSGIGSAMPEIGFALPGTGDYSFLPQFIFYRIIGGIGVGLASMLSPMYIAEIAPASIRGKLVSWNQLAIVTGMLVVYFVNFAITRQGDVSWNEQTGWRWMFASSAIPAVLFLICLLFVPESPRWLVMTGKEKKAANILGRLNAGAAIQKEIASIRASVAPVVVKGLKFGARIWIAGLLLNTFNHGFSFGLFGIMAALSCIFAWKLIPETKGKTLEDMEEIWKIKINNNKR
ncbi:hypothetical protein FACS189440_11710 [Bacteroidia bacterium]|nr:hypothetical protein FACS189423_05510 [Bacteroidia bacterium]GHT48347.1 hypothetical protein FACS189440_11710 [Bacteroidia bacterium]